MAKYIWVTSKGMFTYALDECEDYLLLNAYFQIKQSRKFENTRTIRIFEWYHLREGGTLNDNILMQLNGNLRLLGRPSLSFVNGHTTNYASMRGQEKILRRQEILIQLSAMTSEQRENLIAIKESEAARLAERDPNLPNRPPQEVVGGLQRSEIERRRIALAASQKRDVEFGQRSILHLPDKPDTPEESDPESVPESTTQDTIVELISEMGELRQEVAASRQEVASLKLMLQTIFKIPNQRRCTVKAKHPK